MVDPVARNALSSMVQPVRYALGPTRMLLWIVVGWRGEARITTFSIIIQWDPIEIGDPSAEMTAPKRTQEFSPIETSPLRVALGAT